MSHFAHYEIHCDNLDFIKKALEEMGYEFTEGRHTIRDYYNNERQVELSVKGKPIGFVWNDEAQKYDVVADWWKTGIREKEFTSKASQLHNKATVEDICRRKRLRFGGWTTLEDGSLQMTATRTIW